jgi:peptidyl-prolyl cis-trans isomerase B (cyclophilin B)
MSRMNKTAKGIFKGMCVALLVAAFAYLIDVIFFYTPSTKVDLNDIDLVQLDALEGTIEEGSPIAIITTSFGEIRAVLYPDEAPNAVQNFIDLAESGYYDNTYVFRIQQDTYFAGGSYDNEGNLNEETFNQDNETIDNELSSDLWPFKGAFCSLSAKSGCSGSRFMVLNSIEFTDDIKSDLLSIYSDEENENTQLVDTFLQYGGIPNFAQQMTIFAQTYQGFDVIDKITSQEVEDDDDNLTPASDILIEKVEISTYSKEDSTVGNSNG